MPTTWKVSNLAGFVSTCQPIDCICFTYMPRLTKKASNRPFRLTARFTTEEQTLLVETANRLNMTPSGFARAVLLASTQASPIERLLLAKTCKVEAMLQLLFGGLFSQLNDRIPFEKEHFRQALENAEAVQFRKADEQLARHTTATKDAHV